MYLSTLIVRSAGALTYALPWITDRSPAPVHTRGNLAAYDAKGTCETLTGPQLFLKDGDCVDIGPTDKTFNIGMDFGGSRHIP